ncbi:hypothetical protein M0811_14640 [Anaeramoeba ignava]|uniref:Uncharacterized protein n=1 Tax=Anaeramoeba ignava TaxID=1746090 RepID=A0A9Q0LXE8_ANAIG|nr:hypothetical protein M0811_14640 [Anaeramoeba ignava]
MKKLPKIFGWGYNFYNQLGFQNDGFYVQNPNAFHIFPGHFVSQISSAIENTCFVSSSDEIILQGYFCEKKKIDPKIKLPGIKKIQSTGRGTFIANTISGSVYCWGIPMSEINLGVSLNLNTPQKVLVFEDMFIKDIACGKNQMYFLSQNGDLFACGNWGIKNILGDTSSFLYSPNGEKTSLFLLFKNVDKIYSDACCSEAFFITKDFRIYCIGLNVWGQLGLGHFKEVWQPFEHTKFFAEQIMDIRMTSSSTIFLVKEKGCGQIYSCGKSEFNGLNSHNAINRPQKLEMPDHDIIAITTGSSHSIVLTSKNEILIWGASNSYGQLGKPSLKENAKTPFLHSISQILQSTPFHIAISSGPITSFIFYPLDSYLIQDFLRFFQREENCDSKIVFFDGEKNVHSNVLNMRIGKEKCSKLFSILKKEYKFENFKRYWIFK